MKKLNELEESCHDRLLEEYGDWEKVEKEEGKIREEIMKLDLKELREWIEMIRRKIYEKV